MLEMFKIVCPECGHSFGKSKSGTFTETTCPKCKLRIVYSVEGDTLKVKALDD